MKLAQADQKRFEAQIVELIRTGRMPSLEQVQVAIETTKQKFQPLILAARHAGTEVEQIVARKRS